MTGSAEALRWDMTVPFAGPEAPELAAALAECSGAMGVVAAALDGGGNGADPTAALEGLVEAINRAERRFQVVRGYLYALTSADSTDAAAQARFGQVRDLGVRMAKLRARVVAHLERIDLAPILDRSGIAREHAFVLREMQDDARHQMPLAEEELAAELLRSGSSAWERLHRDLSSQLSAAPERGGPELPMSGVRGLASAPDRAVRARAYEAELATWARSAVPFALALNAIKAEALVLARRRGWDAPLDEALFRARIDRATLEAMHGAARAAFPALRRYLTAKARLIGVPALVWYDLAAPLPLESRRRDGWTYEGAMDFIADRFATYSERLADIALRARRERWIDVEPRRGKSDGGFCVRLVDDVSRILVNFEPSFTSVEVLAHELGHAYHNSVTARLPPLRRRVPLTMAETASMLCETIVARAALEAAEDDDERLELLDAGLRRSAVLPMETISRFDFEERLFERRAVGELSVQELCELMRSAQADCYGEGVDPERLHPYLWAVKPHFYGRAFYNFPYLFGELFGRGLHARYLADPDGFRAAYDDLLAATGEAPVAELTARFGIDVRTPAFWEDGLAEIVAEVDRFVALAAARPQGAG